MTVRTEGSLHEGDILFHALAACSPVGIMLTDVHGSCTYTNPRCRAIGGFSAEEGVGAGWMIFVHPDDRERVATAWTSGLRAGVEHADEFRFRHRNGTVRWVQVRTAPFVGPAGVPLGHVATIEDMTEETAVREMLADREALFRAQYQSIPMPTYTWRVVGDDWVLIDFNRAAEEYTEHQISSALGVSAREFLSYEPDVIEDFERCTRERSTFQREMEHRLGTTGKVRQIVTHYAFAEPDLVMIHTQDVSRQRELERQRDDFLSAAAHDLKTPLTTIKGFVQLLKRRLARDGVLEREVAGPHLDLVERTVNEMNQLAGELLDVTRLQMGQALELLRSEFDLARLVRQVAEESRPSKRHRITIDAPEDPVIGRWDRPRLRRVVANLLANAITYSPHGGAIRLAVWSEGDHAAFAMADEGIGIPAGDLPYIFQRFYRGSNTAGQITGTGIGLAGSRQIVEQHGGTIEVESTEGEGTTVTVRLPVYAPRISAAHNS